MLKNNRLSSNISLLLLFLPPIPALSPTALSKHQTEAIVLGSAENEQWLHFMTGINDEFNLQFFCFDNRNIQSSLGDLSTEEQLG